MISVVQRVTTAAVRVEDREVARIGTGFLALVGAVDGDAADDAEYTADKLLHLRVFPDDEGRMNRSLLDVGGEILLVSQFTLAADTRRGRRPSFARALAPDAAEALLEHLQARLREAGVGAPSGVFGAYMHVDLVNDGPVTVILDSRESRRGNRRRRSS